MIHVENHGTLVHSSNYWRSGLAETGYYYMTPSEGCFRLLIPAARAAEIQMMRTAKEVVISVGAHSGYAGQEMSEVLFDDVAGSPFALYLRMQQWERFPARNDYGQGYRFTAWESRRGTPHKVLSRPCWLRHADLPCLKPIELNGN